MFTLSRPTFSPLRGGWYFRFGPQISSFFLALLLFNLHLAAQDPGQPQPPGLPAAPGRSPLFNIEGRVVAETEGASLSGVHVTLTDFRGSVRDTYETRTGGAFSFSNLTPGRYTLTFSHQDFVEQRQTVDIVFTPPQGLIVTLSRKSSDVSPSMQPTVPAWALQIPARAQKEYDKGLEALEHENAKLSAAHLQAAVQLYPRFASAYGALGTALANTGDSKAAAGAFEKALEIDEKLFIANLGLGNLYLAEKRYGEAEKYLARASMLKPDDWRVQYELGDVYWRTGDWPKAEERLRRAVELHGKLPRIHLLLINALAGQEKYAELLAAMETFLKLFPDDRFAPQVAQKRDLLRTELAKQSTSKEKKQP